MADQLQIGEGEFHVHRMGWESLFIMMSLRFFSSRDLVKCIIQQESNLLALSLDESKGLLATLLWHQPANSFSMLLLQ